MFEQEILRAKKQLSDRFSSNDTIVYLRDILSDTTLHPFYKHFFSAEVEWWIFEQQMMRVSNPRFDYANPEFNTILDTFDDECRRSARFDYRDLEATVDRAVKTRINFVLRPRTTLKWFVYRGEPTKPLSEILLRLSYLSSNEYLIDALRQWTESRRSGSFHLDILSVVEFERAIETIDNEAILDLSAEEFADLLLPIFDFFGEIDPDVVNTGIPTPALIVFLDDKGIVRISQDLERRIRSENLHHIIREQFLHIIEEVLSDIEDESGAAAVSDADDSIPEPDVQEEWHTAEGYTDDEEKYIVSASYHSDDYPVDSEILSETDQPQGQAPESEPDQAARDIAEDDDGDSADKAQREADLHSSAESDYIAVTPSFDPGELQAPEALPDGDSSNGSTVPEETKEPEFDAVAAAPSEPEDSPAVGIDTPEEFESSGDGEAGQEEYYLDLENDADSDAGQDIAFEGFSPNNLFAETEHPVTVSFDEALSAELYLAELEVEPEIDDVGPLSPYLIQAGPQEVSAADAVFSAEAESAATITEAPEVEEDPEPKPATGQETSGEAAPPGSVEGDIPVSAAPAELHEDDALLQDDSEGEEAVSVMEAQTEAAVDADTDDIPVEHTTLPDDTDSGSVLDAFNATEPDYPAVAVESQVSHSDGEAGEVIHENQAEPVQDEEITAPAGQTDEPTTVEISTDADSFSPTAEEEPEDAPPVDDVFGAEPGTEASDPVTPDFPTTDTGMTTEARAEDIRPESGQEDSPPEGSSTQVAESYGAKATVQPHEAQLTDAESGISEISRDELESLSDEQESALTRIAQETEPAADQIPSDKGMLSPETSEPDAATGVEAYPSLQELIAPDLRDKIVRKIFARDASGFDAAVQKLDSAGTWKEALAQIDMIFAELGVKPYSSIAEKFREVVYNRYVR